MVIFDWIGWLKNIRVKESPSCSPATIIFEDSLEKPQKKFFS